jgi:hypothetical protein
MQQTENQREAHALRRYVAARAAGRTHHEWARADHDLMPGFTAWVGCSEVDADSRDDGKTFRRLRRPGMAWCSYLGADTSIAEDVELQAYFEHHAVESHDWNLLKTEVEDGREKALRQWRSRGRAILARAHAERHGDEVKPALNSALAAFLVRGTGRRSLKRVKRG